MLCECIRVIPLPRPWVTHALLPLAIASALAVPASNAADQMPLYKKVGDWSIHVDETLANGCFAAGIWNGGTLFRLGVDNNPPPTLYVIIGNVKWRSLERGKEYDIDLTFGDETPWTLTASGFQFDDESGATYLYADIGKPSNEKTKAFVDEFMRELSVRIVYQGNHVDTLRLTGSYDATETLFECQALMDRTGSRDDPFAAPAQTSDDPFDV